MSEGHLPLIVRLLPQPPEAIPDLFGMAKGEVRPETLDATVPIAGRLDHGPFGFKATKKLLFHPVQLGGFVRSHRCCPVLEVFQEVVEDGSVGIRPLSARPVHNSQSGPA